MFPGLNPKKMQAVMKQMGINQQEIDASKVTIEKQDGSKIVIEPASVVKITMQGQDSFQISGNAREEYGFSEEDIETIMEKTGASKKEAQKALEETGDLAEAILKLS
ncbi:MAG: nascent polypeptide-associated complex protein [Nanoarchaeota archaeon]